MTPVQTVAVECVQLLGRVLSVGEAYLIVVNAVDVLRGHPVGGVCCTMSRLKPVQMECLQCSIAYASNGISFSTCSMTHNCNCPELSVYQLVLAACGSHVSLSVRLAERAQHTRTMIEQHSMHRSLSNHKVSCNGSCRE